MEKEREREENYISVGYTNGNGVTNILLIKGTKVAQQKTRLYSNRCKNEEGKHKI